MVATDGHRLTMVDSRLAKDPSKASIGEGVIIPKKGMLEMKRLLENEEGDCFLGLDGTNMVFRIGGVTEVMRLLDGQFPDYRDVIPESQPISLELNRKAFIDSLRRVSILSSDRMLDIKIELMKGRLRVSTSNIDLGEAREDMEIDYTGKKMAIGFNARYLLDALSVIDTDTVSVSLEDGLSPVVFRPAGEHRYTCVVMPMRI